MIIDFIEIESRVDPVDSRADRADDRFDFFVFENLAEAFLFHVERFAAKRQNGLKLPDTRLLRRAACGIALHDEHFVQFGFSARTGSEFAD